MGRQHIGIFFVFMAISFVVVMAMIGTENNDSQKATKKVPNHVHDNEFTITSKVSQSGIILEDRGDFLALRVENATGTLDDPFILKNMEFMDATQLTVPLTIRNTDLHFIIRNCL